jgi:hypothetical protein
MALGLSHPLTETSKINLPGVNDRPMRKADTLNASLDVSQPHGPPRPVKGIAFSLIYLTELSGWAVGRPLLKQGSPPGRWLFQRRCHQLSLYSAKL